MDFFDKLSQILFVFSTSTFLAAIPLAIWDFSQDDSDLLKKKKKKHKKSHA